MAELKLSDQTSHVCRIIPGMASAGFLFSPYISSNDAFVALAGDNQAVLATKRVVAITVYEEESPHHSFCYQSEIKIRFYRLDFPPQNIDCQVFPNNPALGPTNLVGFRHH
jgi:hypothetical protein